MDRESIVKHISSFTFFNVLANFSRVLISGIVIIYVARTLGPSQYGVVSLALSVAAVVKLFCDFGISASTAYSLAKSDHPSSSVYKSGLVLNIFFSLFFACILFFLAEPIARVINIGSKTYIQIICLFTFFTSLFDFTTSSLQGIKKADKIALLNFLQNIFTNILVFVFAYLGYLATGVLIGYSLGTALIWVLAFVILYSYFNLGRAHLNTQVLKHILLYALPLLLTSSSYMLLLRGPTILLGAYAGTIQVSYFSIPMRIVEVSSLAAFSLSIVIAPFFTQKEQTAGRLSWLYVKVFKYGLLLYLPMAFFFALGAYRIINVVFGPEYGSAANVLVILSFYLPFFAISIFTGKMLDFLGLARPKSIVFAIAAASTIISSFFVIPVLKEIGAALVIAVPYTVFSIYIIIRSSRECGVKLTKYYSKTVKLALLLVLSGIPTYAVLQNSDDLRGLIVSILIYSGLFIILGTQSHLIKISEIRKLMKIWKSTHTV